ncbi:sigma factor-like helix-turn-helix DNA-binding protein [Streptomyces sp. NPDC059389]|uniref:RNA polymerase sigma factor n=1 Tax=Streptomyces sp. NPDC059389 TaxID=3346818 RepID=UPI00369A2A57
MTVTEVPALPAAQTLPAALRTTQQDRQLAQFNAFYRTETRKLTVFLVNLGATPYEAADAVHEAFLTLLPDKWRTLEHPGAWLRTVAYRKYLRQATDRTQPTDLVPDRPGGTCPVDLVLLTEQQKKVLAALGHLPPAERQAVVWKLDGFAHEETAQALGKDPAAVRQAYARGRKRLISILGLKKEATPGE